MKRFTQFICSHENVGATDVAKYFRQNILWILVLTDVHVNDKKNVILELKSKLSTDNITMYLVLQNDTYDDTRFFYNLIVNARFVGICDGFHCARCAECTEFSFSELNSTHFTSNISDMTCNSTTTPNDFNGDSQSFRNQFSKVNIRML